VADDQELMGQATGDPQVLTGEIMVESQLEEWKDVNESVYTWSHFHRMMRAYMFGDYDRAENMSNGCRSIVEYPWGALDVAVVVFFDGLTAVAQAKKTNKKKSPLAEKRLQKLQYWAKHSPLNFLGKQFLLEDTAYYSSCIRRVFICYHRHLSYYYYSLFYLSLHWLGPPPSLWAVSYGLWCTLYSPVTYGMEILYCALFSPL
jgi:hypothetical protein